MTTTKASANSIDDNILASVATIPLVGLIIYFAMPEASANVNHYAKQSIGLLVLVVIQTVLYIISTLAAAVTFGLGTVLYCIPILIGLVIFVAWVWLVMNAFQGKKVVLPFLTDLVNQVI